MIVGELQKNYFQINEMHAKLLQEMHENEPLKEKIKAIENESGDKIRNTFDEIRNILDDR